MVENEFLIPTKENPHPLLKLKGKDKHLFALKSFTITIAVTLILYTLPDYWFLEYATTKGVWTVLGVFGFHPRLFIYELGIHDLGFFDSVIYRLYDGNRTTFPAINIDGSRTSQNNFIIIRACTGMQAGSLLVGLILSTPAKWKTRLRTAYIILFILFIGNIFRIAAQIALATIFINVLHVPFTGSWGYAHDWTGRPIGFIATVAFTLYIEGSGIRILDTITIWIDEVFWFSSLIIGGKKKKVVKKRVVKKKRLPTQNSKQVANTTIKETSSDTEKTNPQKNYPEENNEDKE